MGKIVDKVVEEKLTEAGIDSLEKADQLMMGLLKSMSDKKLLKAHRIFKKKCQKKPTEENKHIVMFVENVIKERGLSIPH